jgi:glycosyltransferase involved in cell wall biosynthesis
MNSFTNGKPILAAAGEYLPVRVVDPSLFTIAYDEALVRALRAEGCEAVLHGRAPRAEEMPPAVPAEACFYRRFDDAPRRLGGVGAALKAAEHVRDSLALAGKGVPGAITHFQWLPFPLVDARIVRRVRRRGPVVVTVHDTRPFNDAPTSRVQRWGFVATLAAADRLVVHTEAGHARLVALGLAPERIRVIPHGPLGVARPLRRRPDAGRFTLVAFGKMRPYKGLDLLGAALGRLDARHRAGLRVIVAGEPMMDLGCLREIVADAGLGGMVEIVPRRLGEAEMERLFERADGFVFPYREVEASGVFYLVQGLERWVIASRIGAFAEAIEDGVSGRLVPPEDVAALAAALVECAERSPVPSAPARVTDWATIARATLETYAEARDAWTAAGGRA